MDELLSGGWNNMERLLEFGPPHLHIGSFALRIDAPLCHISIVKPTDPPPNQPSDQLANWPTNQPTNHPTGQPSNRSSNRQIIQSADPLSQ